nr:MAG TPA: hypothetical protein [Caudoviricetes sp.]
MLVLPHFWALSGGRYVSFLYQVFTLIFARFSGRCFGGVGLWAPGIIDMRLRTWCMRYRARGCGYVGTNITRLRNEGGRCEGGSANIRGL